MKKKLIKFLMMAYAMIIPIQVFGEVVHVVREEQTITKGAKLIREQLLTDKGWQDVYLLKLNMNDSNIEIKPIDVPVPNSKDTILSIAQNTGAVAAINADYFSMDSSAPVFGPMISAGEVIQAYSNRYTSIGSKKNMGTLIVDEAHNIVMDYFDMTVSIIGQEGKIDDAFSYNKIPTSIKIPVVLDRQYMKSTKDLISKQPNIYSIVVENEKVISHPKKGEIVEIPENGFVLVMDETNAAVYRNKLPIGMELKIETTVQLKNQNMYTAEDVVLGIGGGGFLMKNGETYTNPTHIISGNTRNPRSVVATTANTGEMLLIAVDGRGTSIGATHNEMIEILKRYSVKDAMYLDGGGSTTVVARNEGEANVTLQNTPSEGTQRKVMNGIGVFSKNATGKVNELYIDVSAPRTFIGESINLTIRAVDENSNPVTINPNDIKYEIAGVTGQIANNKFQPTSEGKAVITAKYNDVKVTTSIHVSKEPKGLIIEPSVVNINIGENKTIQAYGIDADGYKIPLRNEQLVWTNKTSSVTANGGKISATATGTSTLDAHYANTKARVSVVVGESVVPIESFETERPKWGGDTTTVTGLVQPSKEIRFHGDYAVKMTYVFEKSNNKQVAYTVFEKPVVIPNDANSINMWVNGRKQGDTLKIEVVDAKGKTHYIKLADKIDFEGWKYLSAQLDTDIAMPAKITKIYAYAQSVPEKRTSALYFDHISITRGERNRQGTSVRNDYSFDPMYREKFADVVKNEYLINVIGPTKKNSLVLGQKNIEEISSKLLKGASSVILASTQNASFNLGEKAIVYKNEYSSKQVGNTQIITLGTDSGSVRATNAKQWSSLKSTLSSNEASHIIIVMSQNPLTQFKDAREGNALHDYLVEYKEETGRPIYIVTTGGMEVEVRIEDGIRYIRTPGIISTKDELNKAKFIKFKAVGDKLYYSFESMI
ncbi:MAG: phosphodiester glycosidase family protein [Cellulosilyticaceae bacterium]